MGDPDRLISDAARLREVYHEPGQGATDKVIDHIDAGVAAFVAASPLFVLATAGHDRADASPRGGPAGFVRVLDEHRLAWGDLVGNNRLDSFGNLMQRPEVGLVFLVPGIAETLRVTGVGALVQDDDVRAACALDGRVPAAAVVVTVAECYIHCGAALRRSRLWDPSTWPERNDAPSPSAILKAHMGAERSADEIADGLEHYYANYIWHPGGGREQ